MELALRAIKRIHEIRQRREMAFYENRMKVKHTTELARARKDLSEGMHLIEAPASLREKAPVEIKEKFEQVDRKWAHDMAKSIGDPKKRAKLMEY